jgi:hypothetical protein
MKATFFIGTAMLIFAAACGRSSGTGSIEGDWKIDKIDPSPVAGILAKNTIDIRDALAVYAIADKGQELLPNMISIDGEKMELRTPAGDRDALAYTVEIHDGNDYRMETPKGTITMKLGPADKATLSVEGVTYQLERSGQRD